MTGDLILHIIDGIKTKYIDAIICSTGTLGGWMGFPYVENPVEGTTKIIHHISERRLFSKARRERHWQRLCNGPRVFICETSSFHLNFPSGKCIWNIYDKYRDKRRRPPKITEEMLDEAIPAMQKAFEEDRAYIAGKFRDCSRTYHSGDFSKFKKVTEENVGNRMYLINW
jgi:hypothetical protein